MEIPGKPKEFFGNDGNSSQLTARTIFGKNWELGFTGNPREKMEIQNVLKIQNSLKILDWKCLEMTEVLKRLELIGNDGIPGNEYSEYSDYLK